MAYMSQEHKAEINARLKRVIPKSWKWTLSVRHHSTIVLTIASAPVDLCAEWLRCINKTRAAGGHELHGPTSYVDVNVYHLESAFDESLPIIQRIVDAMNVGNHDRSDITTDYFDVGFYVDVKLGRWDRPFKVSGKTARPKFSAEQIATAFYKAGIRDENSGALWGRYLEKVRSVSPHITDTEARELLQTRRL